MKRIIIHGILHLIGYNDNTDLDKKNMTSLENKYFLKGKKILVIAAAQANSIIVPAIDKDKNVYLVKA